MYKLTETAPAQGYTNAADEYLKVDAAGNLLVSDAADGTFSPYANPDLVVSDAQNVFSIAKVNGGGAALSGAKFTIAGTFAGSAAVETRYLMTEGSEGTMTGALIAGNTYTVSETTAPTGYDKVADFQVAMNDDGTVNLVGTPEGISVTGHAVTVKDVQTEISLAKVDANGASLSGATFTLTGVFADGSTSKTMLDGAATATLTGQLVEGNTYTVSETVAPDGYTTLPDFSVSVAADGTLTLVDAPAGVTLDGTTITAADAPVSIVIEKTDRTTGEQLPNHLDCDFRVTPVNGVTFVDTTKTVFEGNDDELTAMLRGQLRTTHIVETTGGASAAGTGGLAARSAQSDTASTISTIQTTDGTLTVEGAQNIYQIQEIAEPGGYQIEPVAVQFIVDQNGKIHTLDGANIVTSADGTVGLSFSDPAIKAYFAKTDADGTALAGASFELDGTFADGAKTKTFTSADRPYELDAQMVAGTSYTLKETAAPSGYDALAGAVTFTVDNLGEITLTDDASGAATVSGSPSDGMTISVKDTKTAVPAASAASSAKTSDAVPLQVQVALCAAAAAGACMAAEALRRARKRNRTKE